MKQYLKLLQDIKQDGAYKPAAREGMPGTQSLFGYQLRHDLSKGFPLLTTKKMFWKGVVVELLWFLRGDNNIKYLLDNGVNIWNEDAYNYYCKIAKANGGIEQNVILQGVSNKLGTRTPHPLDVDAYSMFQYEEFIEKVKSTPAEELPSWDGYRLGSCGYQYGKVWRNGFSGGFKTNEPDEQGMVTATMLYIDQIKNLIEGLKKTPESRRHLVTSIDPSHDHRLALYWCHAMFQFNCRPMDNLQRAHWAVDNAKMHRNELMFGDEEEEETLEEQLNRRGIPKFILDCQLYQRSADVVLGVPFNIASYALLTHIIAQICGMAPGDFIHTFGDVHIYDNHKEAVEEQLQRTPKPLPSLKIDSSVDLEDLIFSEVSVDAEALLKTFELWMYNPHPAIKAELSTGLKK